MTTDLWGQMLNVALEEFQGVILLRIAGMLDRNTVPQLERLIAFEATKARSQPVRLLFDLSQVLFLDEDGLDGLLHLYGSYGVGGNIELFEPTGDVVQLLHQVDLNGEAWMRSAP